MIGMMLVSAHFSNLPVVLKIWHCRINTIYVHCQ